MIKRLSVREAQAVLPRLSQDQDFTDWLVVEQEGQPRLAILPAEEYNRFKAWERRERARIWIMEEIAQRRPRPDWAEAFKKMDELSWRADFMDDELEGIIDRAVNWARSPKSNSATAQ